MPSETFEPTPSEEPSEFLPTWDLAGATPVPVEKPPICPLCQAPRADGKTFCIDCGFIFPEDAPAAAIPTPPQWLRERYEVGTLLSVRDDRQRYQGHDTLTDSAVVV